MSNQFKDGLKKDSKRCVSFRLACVEAEVKLVDETHVLLLNARANLSNFTFDAIVKSAVVEDQIHILHELLQLAVLAFLKLSFNGTKVHRLLHNGVVIRDAESFDIYWLCKDVGLRVSLQSLHQSLSSFFPLIENWRSLGNVWNLQL